MMQVLQNATKILIFSIVVLGSSCSILNNNFRFDKAENTLICLSNSKSFEDNYYSKKNIKVELAAKDLLEINEDQVEILNNTSKTKISYSMIGCSKYADSKYELWQKIQKKYKWKLRDTFTEVLTYRLTSDSLSNIIFCDEVPEQGYNSLTTSNETFFVDCAKLRLVEKDVERNLIRLFPENSIKLIGDLSNDFMSYEIKSSFLSDFQLEEMKENLKVQLNIDLELLETSIKKQIIIETKK